MEFCDVVLAAASKDYRTSLLPQGFSRDTGSVAFHRGGVCLLLLTDRREEAGNGWNNLQGNHLASRSVGRHAPSELSHGVCLAESLRVRANARRNPVRHRDRRIGCSRHCPQSVRFAFLYHVQTQSRRSEGNEGWSCDHHRHFSEFRAFSSCICVSRFCLFTLLGFSRGVSECIGSGFRDP